MDFTENVEIAKKFAELNGPDLIVSSVEETEQKIYFRNISKDCSFYVSAEKDGDTLGWTVWSDNENILPYLESFLESTDGNIQLEDLLKNVYEKLKLKIINEKDDDSDDDEDDDEDDMDGYYAEDDVDAKQEEKEDSDSNTEEVPDSFFPGKCERSAVQRLMSDFKNLSKTNGRFGIDACPRGGNLQVWDVKLMDFPSNSKLGQDLKKYAEKYKREPVLSMEMQFPSDYPMSPPFVRVLRPRIQFLTGHVTIGGSICMELLTKSGWRPTNDIESILINVRSEIMSDPRACLDTGKGDTPYSEQEARDAFRRMVQRYNWDK